MEQVLPLPHDHAESSSDASPPEGNNDMTQPPMEFDVLDNDMFDELVNFDTPPATEAAIPQQAAVPETDMMLVSRSPPTFNLSLKNEDFGIHTPTNLDFFAMQIIPPPLKTASFPGMSGIEAYLFRHYTHTLAACVCRLHLLLF